MEAKRARREGHPRRPALHAHERDRRPARAAPRRHRHRLPRRPDQPHPRERPRVPRVRRALHERAGDRQRGVPRHRGPRRPLLRLATRTTASTTSTRWSYEGMRGEPRPASREQAGDVVRRPGARRARRGRSRDGEPPEHRRDARAPALRLPGPQAPLRALHAGDGRARLRRPARAVPRRSPRRCARTRAASARRRSATRSAGRSTRPACRYIRAASILQLLLGNIGRPGGGILALRGHA